MGIIAVPPVRLHPTLNPPDSVKLNTASWFAQQQTARVWHSNASVGLTDLSQNQNHAITQGFGIGKQPSQFGSGVYGDVSANPIPALSGYSTPVGSAMLTGASEITMWGVVCFSDLSQSNETDLMRAETYESWANQYAFDLFPSTGVFRPLLTTSGTTGWSTGNDVTVSGLKTGELYLMLTRWQSGQVFETLVQPVGSALAGYLSNTSVPSGTITSNGVVPTNIGGMGYAGVAVQTFPGWIYLAGVVGAYMPDGVVAELLADPFNYVLKPTNDLLPVHISSGSGVALSASSTVILTGTGTVNQAISIIGSGTVVVTGTGNLAQAIALSSNSTVDLTGVGTVAQSIQLESSEVVTVTSTGTLSQLVEMAATSTITVTGVATGTQSNALQATSTVTVTGSGTLQEYVALVGTGNCVVSSSGTVTLNQTIQLSGSGTVTLFGSLNTTKYTVPMFSSTINLGLTEVPNPTGNIHVDRELKKIYSAFQALQIGIDAVNTGISTYTFNASYGQLVSVYNNSGISSAQAAVATSAATAAVGFCSTFAGVNSGSSGIVKTNGVIQGLSGLVQGTIYYLSPTIPGGFTATKPTTAGQIVQVIGVALDSSNLFFNPTLTWTQL